LGRQRCCAHVPQKAFIRTLTPFVVRARVSLCVSEGYNGGAQLEAFLIMSIEDKLGLNSGERIAMTIHSTPVIFAVPVFFASVVMFAPFFFMLPLLSLGNFGLAVMGVFSGLGAFFLLRVAVKWFGTKVVMTNRRIFIIRRDGFFARKVHALPYGKVQGVSYRIKGLKQTIFRYGTVLVRPIAGRPLRIMGIRHPQKLANLITEVVDESETGDFGDLLQAVSDMRIHELRLLHAEIEHSLGLRRENQN